MVLRERTDGPRSAQRARAGCFSCSACPPPAAPLLPRWLVPHPQPVVEGVPPRWNPPSARAPRDRGERGGGPKNEAIGPRTKRSPPAPSLPAPSAAKAPHAGVVAQRPAPASPRPRGAQTGGNGAAKKRPRPSAPDFRPARRLPASRPPHSLHRCRAATTRAAPSGRTSRTTPPTRSRRRPARRCCGGGREGRRRRPFRRREKWGAPGDTPTARGGAWPAWGAARRPPATCARGGGARGERATARTARARLHPGRRLLARKRSDGRAAAAGFSHPPAASRPSLGCRSEPLIRSHIHSPTTHVSSCIFVSYAAASNAAAPASPAMVG